MFSFCSLGDVIILCIITFKGGFFKRGIMSKKAFYFIVVFAIVLLVMTKVLTYCVNQLSAYVSPLMLLTIALLVDFAVYTILGFLTVYLIKDITYVHGGIYVMATVFLYWIIYVIKYRSMIAPETSIFYGVLFLLSLAFAFVFGSFGSIIGLHYHGHNKDKGYQKRIRKNSSS